MEESIKELKDKINTLSEKLLHCEERLINVEKKIMFLVKSDTLNTFIKNKNKLNEMLINYACDVFNVTEKEISSSCRKSNLLDCRDSLAYIFTKVLGYTQYNTGKILNRNHSTIYVSITKVENLLTYRSEQPKLLDNRGIRILDTVDTMKQMVAEFQEFSEISIENKERNSLYRLKTVQIAELLVREYHVKTNVVFIRTVLSLEDSEDMVLFEQRIKKILQYHGIIDSYEEFMEKYKALKLL